MKGYKPYAEIYYNKRKDIFNFHISTKKFDVVTFVGYMMWLIHQLHHPKSYGDNTYDTAKPEDRKKLNRK